VKRGRIEAFDGKTRKVVLAIDGARVFGPNYFASGHIVFRREGSGGGIWAVPFSPETLATTGPPFRILPPGSYSLSRDDTLVFQETSTAPNPARLVWVDRHGAIAGTIGEPMPRIFGTPALSPDGRHAAVAALDDEALREQLPGDIFVFDLRTGARYPLRDDLGTDVSPYWKTGGKAVGFVTYAAGIRDVRERSMDGTGEPTLIRRALWAKTSRDGRILLTYYTGDGLLYTEEGSREQHPPIPGEFQAVALSPDNRFLAYTLTSEPGLFLKRFPSGAGMIAVTSEEAESPRWRADGRELYFWRKDTLMAVPIDSTSDESPKPGAAQALFSAADQRLVAKQYDVADDGRFLMLQKTGDPSAIPEDPGIVVIQNWAVEYQRK